MSKTTALLLTLTAFLCPLPARASDPALPGKQQVQATDIKLDFHLDYLLYLPADYGKDPAKKWPLIVYLHGSGEVGGDIDNVTGNGPPSFLETSARLRIKNFVVVSPHCPESTGGWRFFLLNPFLDQVLAQYNVDPTRVYLTGVSMGGFGTWNWAQHNPERFAAIAPMSGGGDTKPAMVAALAHMPIWVFHGEKDTTVPIKYSERMVQAVRKTGNQQVKFTRYPNAGHVCWDQAYCSAPLYDWFLKFQSKTIATPPPPGP